MDSGNLPPGVTGREDAFGPQSVFIDERSCEEEATFIVWDALVSSTLTQLNRAISKSQTRDQTAYAWIVEVEDAQHALLKALRRGAEFARLEYTTCPFVGDVEVSVWNSKITWECPLCDVIHDEALPEPDFDEDAAMDRSDR